MNPAMLNDGSGRPPRLRADVHLGTVWDLPDWSTGPGRDDGDPRVPVVAIGPGAGGAPAYGISSGSARA